MTNHEVASEIRDFLKIVFRNFKCFEYTISHDSSCWFLATILYDGAVKTTVMFYNENDKIYFSKKIDNYEIFNTISGLDLTFNSEAIIDFWTILSMEYADRLRNN